MGLVQEDMPSPHHLLTEIRRASLEEICGDPIRDASMGEMVRVGLLLAAGGLEEAHRIVQQCETPEAYYWHGIVHRREPDWANAKYWFRRLGNHPVFDELDGAGFQAALSDAAGFDRLAKNKPWDPFLVIALCQACVGGTVPHLRKQLEAVQREEVSRLLHYCHGRAVA